MSPSDFDELAADVQVQVLAFEVFRQREESFLRTRGTKERHDRWTALFKAISGKRR